MLSVNYPYELLVWHLVFEQPNPAGRHDVSSSVRLERYGATSVGTSVSFLKEMPCSCVRIEGGQYLRADIICYIFHDVEFWVEIQPFGSNSTIPKVTSTIIFNVFPSIRGCQSACCSFAVVYRNMGRFSIRSCDLGDSLLYEVSIIRT